jgi:hypothetical protein
MEGNFKTDLLPANVAISGIRKFTRKMPVPPVSKTFYAEKNQASVQINPLR